MIAWAMERVPRRGIAKDPPPTNNKRAGDGRTYCPLPLRRPSVTAVVRRPGDGEQAGAQQRRRRSRVWSSRRLRETALAPSQAGVLDTTSLSW